MTQGPAVAYGLDTEIGNLNAGSYADFVLLDLQFSDLSALRLRQADTPTDVLFALSMLSDERAFAETWVAGKIVHQSDKNRR